MGALVIGAYPHRNQILAGIQHLINDGFEAEQVSVAGQVQALETAFEDTGPTSHRPPPGELALRRALQPFATQLTPFQLPDSELTVVASAPLRAVLTQLSELPELTDVDQAPAVALVAELRQRHLLLGVETIDLMVAEMAKRALLDSGATLATTT